MLLAILLHYFIFFLLPPVFRCSLLAVFHFSVIFFCPILLKSLASLLVSSSSSITSLPSSYVTVKTSLQVCPLVPCSKLLLSTLIKTNEDSQKNNFLDIRGSSYSALAKLQHDLGGVEYCIDEFSVIGQKMFAWINRRPKQAIQVTLQFLLMVCP